MTDTGRAADGTFTQGNTIGAETQLNGRETLYKPEYDEQARKVAQLGATVAEIADFFEVTDRTIYKWCHAHPSFGEAIKVGKAPADDRMERSLYELGLGFTYSEDKAIVLRDSDGNERVEVVKVTMQRPPDGQAAFKWLCNRRPDDWRDQKNLLVGGALLHIPTAAKAREELEAFFRDLSTMVALPAPAPPDLGTEADRADDF